MPALYFKSQPQTYERTVKVYAASYNHAREILENSLIATDPLADVADWEYGTENLPPHIASVIVTSFFPGLEALGDAVSCADVWLDAAPEDGEGDDAADDEEEQGQ